MANPSSGMANGHHPLESQHMGRRGEALCGTHTVAVPPSFSPFSPFPSSILLLRRLSSLGGGGGGEATPDVARTRKGGGNVLNTQPGLFFAFKTTTGTGFDSDAKISLSLISESPLNAEDIYYVGFGESRS